MTTDPSSFCTICTDSCKGELIGFLLSLSIHHPNSNVYVMCDSESKDEILSLSIQPNLCLHWFLTLDKYTGLDRGKMERQGIWSDFQMAKAHVIQKALQFEDDTLFLDCDIIVLDALNGIDHSKLLGVSPQFIQQNNVDQVGYYNGGMLWTRDKELPRKWIEYTKTSRYFDQASIENLAEEYGVHGSGGFGVSNTQRGFEFGEHYNLQTWRFYLGLENEAQIKRAITIRGREIYYRDPTKPLKFIHTHFNKPDFNEVNQYFINLLTQAGRYRELLIMLQFPNNQCKELDITRMIHFVSFRFCG